MYEEFGNFLASRYIMLCHYLKRWLSTLNSQIQDKRLCMFITTSTTLDVGCVFLHVWKVLPLTMLLLEGQGSEIWKSHVQNWSLSLPNVDGQIDPFLAFVFVGLQCILCEQSLGATIMLVCDQCSRGCIWDAWHHLWMNKLVNGSVFYAWHKHGNLYT